METFPFHFGELPNCSEMGTSIVQAGFGGSVEEARGLPDFAGVVVKADCLAQLEGAAFLPWHSQ